MLVVELRELANLLSSVNLRPDLIAEARRRAGLVQGAIWKYGVINTTSFGEVFAYEVDGKTYSTRICCVSVLKILLSGYGGVVIQDGKGSK